jgi:hypothetical protein
MSRAQAKSDLFRAIADPTRRAILDRLRDGAAPVNALGREFAQSRPAISKHLRVLRETHDNVLAGNVSTNSTRPGCKTWRAGSRDTARPGSENSTVSGAIWTKAHEFKKFRAGHRRCRLRYDPRHGRDRGAAHAAYWADRLQEGRRSFFGPVADPKGGWGLAVVRVADEAAVHALEAGDPAIQSERGFHYEILPIPGAKF